MTGEPLVVVVVDVVVSETRRISLLRLRGSCITSQLEEERGLGSSCKKKD